MAALEVPGVMPGFEPSRDGVVVSRRGQRFVGPGVGVALHTDGDRIDGAGLVRIQVLVSAVAAESGMVATYSCSGPAVGGGTGTHCCAGERPVGVGCGGRLPGVVAGAG